MVLTIKWNHTNVWNHIYFIHLIIRNPVGMRLALLCDANPGSCSFSFYILNMVMYLYTLYRQMYQISPWTHNSHICSSLTVRKKMKYKQIVDEGPFKDYKSWPQICTDRRLLPASTMWETQREVKGPFVLRVPVYETCQMRSEMKF